MGYNTKAEIMARLKEHWAAAAKIVPESKIIGIFLQGSQDYNLATSESDIDTRCVVAPLFKDVLCTGSPCSLVHTMPNGETIDIKDIRLVVNTFKKQNINSLEILFTDYYIINPKYAKQWERLKEEREAIARYSPYAVAKTIKGMVKDRYNSFLNKYLEGSCSGKALSYLNRFYYFFYDYFYKNKLYAETIQCDENRKKYLLMIKDGALPPIAAYENATSIYNAITLLADVWCKEHPQEKGKTDPYVDKLFHQVLFEIVKKSFKEDLKREK